MLLRWILLTLSVFFFGFNTACGAWSEDIRITNDTADSYRPSIAIDSNDNLHVIWIEDDGVYYTKLDATGSSLVDAKRIAYLRGISNSKFHDFMVERGRPAISIDSNDNAVVAYLCFSDADENVDPELQIRNVVYMKLDNNGDEIASLRVNVNNPITTKGYIYPYSIDLCVNSENHVYVVWEGHDNKIANADRELYYSELNENNNIILPGSKRLTNDDLESYVVNGFPSIDADHLDNINVMSCAGYVSPISYTVMTKDEIKLKDNVDIGVGNYADVAADSQNINAVWWGQFPSILYYTKLNTDGNAIIFPKNILSTLPANTGRPEIDVGPTDNVHLVADFAVGTELFSIYYMLLDSTGTIQISETKIVDSGSVGKRPWGPDIAVDSKDCAHIVWVDQRNGNEEIYYKNSCDGNGPEKFDFGDAPDPSYPTLLASNGARHKIKEDVYLGQLIDGESDGQPTPGADGDDKNNLDDEDGVTFVTPLQNGSTATVKVKASVAGKLNAWADFNKDGDWSEQDEQIFQDKVLVPGTNTLTFDVPLDAAIGSTYARFRFNTVGGLSFEGPADDGEVEDYVIKIDPLTPPTPAKSKNNKEMIKVGNKESIAFGYSYAINNIKVVTNSQ